MAEQKKFVVKNGLVASGLTYPTADGTDNQLLKTDASGNISFATPSTDHIDDTGASNKFYSTVLFDSDFGEQTTDTLSEGSVNIFFTDARANTAIDARVDVSFVNNLNIDASTVGGQNSTYLLDYTNFTNTPNTLDSADVRNVFSAAGDLSYDSATGQFSVTTTDAYGRVQFDSDIADIDTDALSEGSTNLYYTDARADARIAAASTDDVSEGSTNLYYTDARANSAIDTRVDKAFVDALNVDADTLDGLNSTQFLRSDIDATHAANLTVDSDLTVNGVLKGPANFYIDPLPYDSAGGSVIIRGDLQVNGTTTTINSTSLNVGDLNLTLADSAADAASADGAGLTIGGDGYTGTKATFQYNGSTDEWEINKTLNLTGSTSLELGGVDFKEVLEDHLANNTFVAGEGVDITYDDTNNTITFAAEIATDTNAGVAQFDSNEFDVAGDGMVTLDTIDGGSY